MRAVLQSKSEQEQGFAWCEHRLFRQELFCRTKESGSFFVDEFWSAYTMVTAPAPSGQPYTKNPQVERKLRDAIIPNMLLADKLKWNWLFVVYAIYAYASDFLAAISGAGISFPLSKFAAGGAVQIDE